MKPRIIVILGPTATYKTTLAVKLAKLIDAAIINADAFQVYQELNIGVNKPSNQIQQEVKFYLLNSLSIYDDFNIQFFQKECFKLIDQLVMQHKNIIICGGSNLYIDSIINNYQLDKYPDRSEITYFDHWKYEDIYDYLNKFDSNKAQKIGFNNKVRIIRAAQQAYCDLHLNNQQKNLNKPNPYEFLIIQTTLERQLMYERINQRVEVMLANHWVDEVKELYKKDPNLLNLNAMKAIGYQQILEALINQQDVDIEKIKRISRNYAKKQLTWIRNKYLNRIDFNFLTDDFNKLLDQVKQFLGNKTIF